nr:hypothetical protein CFP56_72997 [Quercus suber]
MIKGPIIARFHELVRGSTESRISCKAVTTQTQRSVLHESIVSKERGTASQTLKVEFLNLAFVHNRKSPSLVVNASRRESTDLSLSHRIDRTLRLYTRIRRRLHFIM